MTLREKPALQTTENWALVFVKLESTWFGVLLGGIVSSLRQLSFTGSCLFTRDCARNQTRRSAPTCYISCLLSLCLISKMKAGYMDSQVFLSFCLTFFFSFSPSQSSNNHISLYFPHVNFSLWPACHCFIHLSPPLFPIFCFGFV